jgi:uncharacterized tellurite resistance protein B-like protein
MFLAALNTQERKMFLELAHHAIASDGVFHEDQIEMYKSYEYECEMPGYELQNISTIEISKKLAGSTKKKKRIMIMELWGIIAADDEIHEKEEEFMAELNNLLDFSQAQGRKMKRWSLDFVDLIEDGYRIIEG